MNIYWIDMLVVPVVQFAAKSTQKTAVYFASKMDRKWRPSNKNRNVIGQTLFRHGSATMAPGLPPSVHYIQMIQYSELISNAL